MGRWFWGESDDGFSLTESEVEELRRDIRLSGVNWLNTFGLNLPQPYISADRKYDVAVLIGLVGENKEYGWRTDEFYNDPRISLFEEVKKLTCSVFTTQKTGKLNRTDYLRTLRESKICISPFGFGEVNIREVESMMSGNILIKPDISMSNTYPYIYGDGMSFSCKPDYSDLSTVVDFILTNYEKIHRIYPNEQYLSYRRSSDPSEIARRLVEEVLT